LDLPLEGAAVEFKALAMEMALSMDTPHRTSYIKALAKLSYFGKI
jgi:hypothetical protein